MDALLSLGCSRRILLTGTPVQNNLEEARPAGPAPVYV